MAVYENPFSDCEMYRWENLAKYHKNGDVAILDIAFDNPDLSIEERKGILDRTNLNEAQKEFLLNVYDVDYLVICGKDAYLVEEKIRGVDDKEFNRRQYIYLLHGTPTQHENLKKASLLGINAGVLLHLVKSPSLKDIPLEYEPVKPSKEMWKFYQIQELIYMENTNQSKIIIDDFIRKGRELGNVKVSV